MAETYLSDMSACLPAAAVGTGPKHGRWRLIDYEAEGLNGKMLWANSMTEAPDVTYPARLKGWHSVYVGIWDWAWSKVPVMVTEGQVEGGNLIKIKLTSDDCFTTISKEFSDFHIEEVLWKHADLTGEEFIVGQQSEGFSRRAGLAYIRVVPLSDQEAAGVKREEERKDTKRLIAMNDGWSWVYENHPSTRQDIQSQIVRYKGSDFGRVFYEYGFAGPQGLESYDVDDFPRKGDAFANDSEKLFRAAGIYPFDEILSYGHWLGLEVFASVRLGMPKTAPPFDVGSQDGGQFYLDHLQFRCIERDGSPFPIMSYAFPEVRTHVTETFQKAVASGADGLCALFHRGPPFLLYEKPLVDGFLAETGQDPRRLPENDETWLKYRARYMTEFMKELKAAAAQTSKDKGRAAPKIACVIFPTRQENLKYGIDVEAFVREGLVDEIVARDILYASWEDTKADVPFFTRITKGTKCKFNVMLGSAASSYRALGGSGSVPDAYATRAGELYRQGVDGLAFWDMHYQEKYTATWSTMRRLGHADELMSQDFKSPKVRSIALKTVGGIDVSFRHDAWYYV
jgi:hypothetical protein